MNSILLTLLSTIFGYILKQYILPFIVLLFKKRDDKLCDNWNVYLCWIEDEKIEFSSMSATIKKGMTHEYDICFDDECNHYKGKGYIELDYLCVDMCECGGSPIKDTTHHRYNLSMLDTKNLCYGLWLSSGYNSISCGGVIISKNKISNDEIRDIFERKYDVKYIIDNKFPLISLK